MLRVRCVQEAIRRAYYDRDASRGLFQTFSWLVEEVGELSEALRKGDKGSMAEEIADVIAWTISIANLVGVDVEEALRSKYGGELSGCEG
nr:MazG nucleotide pyrophosphohydrolase domain-containing protein [Aeropyrum pernix]